MAHKKVKKSGPWASRHAADQITLMCMAVRDPLMSAAEKAAELEKRHKLLIQIANECASFWYGELYRVHPEITPAIGEVI